MKFGIAMAGFFLVCSPQIGAALPPGGPSASLELPSEKHELAAELVDLLQYEALFNSYLAQCQKPDGTYFDPEVAYLADSTAFGGIGPDDAEWSEIAAIYRRYQRAVCSYLSAKEFNAFFVEAYEMRLSAKELREAIAFQRSSTGLKLQRTSMLINQDYLSYSQVKMTSLHREAYATASAEVKEVIIQYRKRQP